MARGRKPTPDNVKSIRGTVQPCRQVKDAVELPTIDEMPDPPDWLPNIHAVKEWETIGPILVANRLLTRPGLAAFGQMCALYGKLIQLWTAGETPNSAMLGQYIKFCSEFAMTPASQSRVRMGDKDGKSGNKFTDGGPKRKRS